MGQRSGISGKKKVATNPSAASTVPTRNARSMPVEASDYVSGVLVPLMALAFCLGLIFVTTTIVAVTGIGANESGLRSALLNVGQQLGGSMGVAVLGTIAATVTKNDLLGVLPSHAAINHAVTSGSGMAVDIASLIPACALPTPTAAVRRTASHTTIN